MEIVLGLDGSPGADAAAHWVAQLGSAVHANVTAVHVVPRIELWDLAAFQIDSDPIIDAQAALLRGRWTDPLRAAGVPVVTKMLRGDPATELCSWADDSNADLLVIGAKRHSALHGLLGGTAHKVANHSRTAVVLVPAERPPYRAEPVSPAGARRATVARPKQSERL